MVASTSSFLLIRFIGSITDPVNATFSATNINAKIVNNDAIKLQKVCRASIRRFRFFLLHLQDPKTPRYITRPNHASESAPAINANAAAINAKMPEISVSFFSTVSLELSVL